MTDTESDDGAAAATAARPLLRVVRGELAAEELAALVAVVTARASGTGEPEPTPASRWAMRSAGLRRPLPHGPGAWRASALPGAH
jgi:hypothetical protein